MRSEPTSFFLFCQAPDAGADEFVDTDNDGLADWWEKKHFSDLTQTGSGDFDNDGLSNSQEYVHATDPTLDADADGDGLSDADEILLHGTDPHAADTDGDGMPDAWEVQYGLNPLADDADGDLDGDGLTNLWEYTWGFDPSDSSDVNRDDDQNGIPDWWEFTHFGVHVDPQADPDNDELTNLQEYQNGTDPNNWDTDGDLLPDGWEVAYGLDPLDATGANGANGDPDNDGLSNLKELMYRTNPVVADTDGDGVNDGTEVDQGSNPNNDADEGQAPPPEEIVEVPFSVGDPSGSYSERWKMIIQGEGPDDSQQIDLINEEFGKVETTNLKLRRGYTYTITLSHVATNMKDNNGAPDPDYDWQAQIDGKPTTTVLASGLTHSGANRVAVIKDTWVLDNEDGLLGVVDQGFGSTNHTAGKKAKLIPVQFKVYPDEETGPDKPHKMNMDTRQKEKLAYNGYEKFVGYVYKSGSIDLISYLDGADDPKIREVFEEALKWQSSDIDIQ